MDIPTPIIAKSQLLSSLYIKVNPKVGLEVLAVASEVIRLGDGAMLTLDRLLFKEISPIICFEDLRPK